MKKSFSSNKPSTLMVPENDKGKFRSGPMSKLFNRYKRYVLISMSQTEPLLSLEEYYYKLRHADAQDRVIMFEQYLLGRASKS